MGDNLQANGKNIYSEEIFTIPEDAIISPGFQTTCSERDLIHPDEVPDANYTFYGLVDPNHEITDTSRSNNYNEIN